MSLIWLVEEINKEHEENIFHVVVNVNLMVKNVIQINSWIKNWVDESAKSNKASCM